MRYTDIWNDLNQKNGVLGRHGRSIYYLRTKIYGICLVVVKEIYNKKLIYKGYTHSTLFAKSRNGFKFSRIKSTRNVPRCHRYNSCCTVQSVENTLPDFLQKKELFIFLLGPPRLGHCQVILH